ncbi:hypothetical protein PBCV1_a325R [Paramecium bursaria Chlorella virus 1]|uniref:Uncharacterized protein n=1 Tax=Paramecium bursaria Chlorella virus 1 TaxID=10506 RepID=Q84639_PBCV1|nr:hypothetical protein PBCV1_a325R [Paramecium bursaria Chlorella virus 1]AAC96693.1 hypothetical protein [Paramecium bursaria Chlorella virus 1]
MRVHAKPWECERRWRHFFTDWRRLLHIGVCIFHHLIPETILEEIRELWFFHILLLLNLRWLLNLRTRCFCTAAH